MKRVYLSGPMSGLPELNFPAFNAAAALLRAQGLSVINPAEINADPNGSWESCMRADIKALCDCDAHCVASWLGKQQGCASGIAHRAPRWYGSPNASPKALRLK